MRNVGLLSAWTESEYRRSLMVAALSMLCSAGCKEGEQFVSVAGTVRSSLTQVPLDSVQVADVQSGCDSVCVTLQDLTGPDGRFEVSFINLLPPDASLEFSRRGYSTVLILLSSVNRVDEDSYSVDVALSPLVVK